MGKKIELYVHAVRSTWKRRPMICAELEGELKRTIGAKCIERDCTPIAIGGTADQMHLLVAATPRASAWPAWSAR